MWSFHTTSKLTMSAAELELCEVAEVGHRVAGPLGPPGAHPSEETPEVALICV